MTTELNETPSPEETSQVEVDPWGDNFDAERAKKLIENLRADKAGLRERLTAAESALEAEKERSGKLESELNTARREHAMADILREHPELELLQDRLQGESVEEIRADAEKLAKALKGIKPEDDKPKEDKPAEEAKPAEDPEPQDGEEEPKPEPKPARRPVPKVRPAHGGEQSRPFDPVAIARAARANR